MHGNDWLLFYDPWNADYTTQTPGQWKIGFRYGGDWCDKEMKALRATILWRLGLKKPGS